MKIGVLSRNSKLYSTRRLVEAARERGHDARVVDVLKCYMNITANNPTVFYKGSGAPEALEFDAVIPRIGASVTLYGAAVLRQFEGSGTYSVNESIAITRSRDKLRAHQLLARRGIGQPITSYAHSADATADLIQSVGGAPRWVKVLKSTQGNGVVLADTKKAAEILINAFRGMAATTLSPTTKQRMSEPAASRMNSCTRKSASRPRKAVIRLSAAFLVSASTTPLPWVLFKTLTSSGAPPTD